MPDGLIFMYHIYNFLFVNFIVFLSFCLNFEITSTMPFPIPLEDGTEEFSINLCVQSTLVSLQIRFFKKNKICLMKKMGWVSNLCCAEL